jgi:hypothetical protein
MLIVPPAEGVIVMVEAALFEVSVTEVAVSVTVAGEGTATGAVYVMATPEALELEEIVPHVTPLHPAPDNTQVTP